MAHFLIFVFNTLENPVELASFPMFIHIHAVITKESKWKSARRWSGVKGSGGDPPALKGGHELQHPDPGYRTEQGYRSVVVSPIESEKHVLLRDIAIWKASLSQAHATKSYTNSGSSTIQARAVGN